MHRPPATLAIACFFVSALAAQAPSGGVLKDVIFEGSPALLLSNDKLELVIVKQGGSMADLFLKDDPRRLSPMWNPARMARELGQESNRGGGTGHFVCVDGFGPVSPEEQAAGLNSHGEAFRQPWRVRDSGRKGSTSFVTFTTTLPIVQENFTRTVEVVDGEQVVYVESELENLLGFDRPVIWAEHATIGSPFLEPGVTVVDMPVSRARTRKHPAKPSSVPRRLASFEDFTWPMAPTVDGGKVDMRTTPAETKLDHAGFLMDTSRRLVFVTALNPAKRLLFGYVFRREEYPWLQSWEHNPPTKKLARGLEFSTQPYDVPRREVISMNSMFDTPLYRWLPAKSKIGSRFLMFYTQAPEGFTKVDDVRQENGRLIIEDRGAGKRITLAASKPL